MLIFLEWIYTRNKLLSLFPFFSALFLVINPALLWVFKRYDQNLQKLQFWAMLTAGLAWLISLVFFFFSRDYLLNPVWDAGEKLLPSLAFSLDWISSSYFLALTTLIFFGILTEGHSPETSAWITGMGGICVIGTLVDSAYTLALIWAAVEAVALYSFLRNQVETSASFKYIFGILARLTAPLLIIYASLVNSSAGIAPFLTELPSSAAPLLLAAGVMGFMGWFLTPKISNEMSSIIQPGKYQSWIPAVLGLVLVTRATQISNPEDILPIVFLVGSMLIVIVLLANLILNTPDTNWKYGILALTLAGYGFAAPDAVLSWGMIFTLPGLVLFGRFRSKRTASLALIIAGIGILPLPFFSSWVGLASLTGISGLFFSISAGMFLGSVFNHRVQVWREIKTPTEQLSPLVLTGYGVILISQYAIAIQSGLIKISLAFTSIPFSAWIAALLFGIAVLFWDRIPEIHLSRFDTLLGNARKFVQAAGNTFRRLADGVIFLFTRLFEGDGGLIWTLLLGFLIITLLASRGR
jgi:hypothetical protein